MAQCPNTPYYNKNQLSYVCVKKMNAAQQPKSLNSLKVLSEVWLSRKSVPSMWDSDRKALSHVLVLAGRGTTVAVH